MSQVFGDMHAISENKIESYYNILIGKSISDHQKIICSASPPALYQL